MDHTAAPFVPKGKATQRSPQTEPVTPPLGSQKSPHGPPSGAGFAPPGARPPPGAYGAGGYYGGGGYGGSGYGPGPHSGGLPPPHLGSPHHPHHHPRPGPPYGGGGGGYGHYHDPAGPAQPPNRPPAYSAAPSSPPRTPVTPGGSKLRAAASVFVPGGGARKSSPAPEDGDGSESAATAKSASAEPGKSSTKSPSSPLTADALTKLRAGAAPYTPTQRTPAGAGKDSAFPTEPTSSRDSPAPAGGGAAASSEKPGALTDVSATGESPTSPLSPSYSGPADTFATSKLPLPEGAPKPATEVKLHSTWCLFADSHPINIGAAGGGGGFGPTPADYNPTLLRSVSTLEEFWRLWRSLKPPSQQVPSFTLHFFRRPVSPTWEDPKNRSGGVVGIPLWDRDRMSLQDRIAVIDDAWWLVTMALAGESLPNALTINGAVLKIRQRNTLLQVWTSTSDQKSLQETVDALREALKPRLASMPLIQLEGLEFYKHASADQSKPMSPAAARPSKGGKGAKAPKREADYKL